MEKVVKNIKMPLPESVRVAVGILENQGYAAYVVGGCVRDFVMGKTPHDFDMTTNATPDQIIAAFDGYTLITAGVKHGTVAVMIDGEKIEITTYRIDGEYNDSRHPESVTFSSRLCDDTLRRDFTMNALAYSDSEGIVDFNGGLEDIEKKTVRAVGEPKKRFEEDALRILRAIRFSSVLDFDIDDSTATEAKKCAKLLGNISAERICEELDKLLAGRRTGECFLGYSDVFSVVLPELYPLPNDKIRAFDSEYVNLFVSYAVLLRGFEARQVADICRRLKFSNERKSKVQALLSVEALPKTKTEAKWLANKLGMSLSYDFLKYKSAYGESTEKAEEYLFDIEQNNECYSLKQLAIDGRDLISIGITDGEKIGKTLAKALNAVICGELENSKEAILKYIN